MAMYPVSVSTSSTEIARYNEKRTSLVILNNGLNVVFISQDEANILANGYPLDPGGAVSFTEIDGDEPALRIYGQTSAGTSDVRVTEGYGLSLRKVSE